jgi:hypothetical protein
LCAQRKHIINFAFLKRERNSRRLPVAKSEVGETSSAELQMFNLVGFRHFERDPARHPSCLADSRAASMDFSWNPGIRKVVDGVWYGTSLGQNRK